MRGVEANEDICSVAVDSISNKEPPSKTPDNISDYGERELNFRHLRHRLARALRAQPNHGGVERKHFDALSLDATSCKEALKIEWAHYTADVKKLGQHPGMSEPELNRLANKHELIDRIQHTRHMIQIWEEVREFLNRADIDVSGRLTLVQDNGQLTIKWRGIKQISAQFKVPTLLLNATQPPLAAISSHDISNSTARSPSSSASKRSTSGSNKNYQTTSPSNTTTTSPDSITSRTSASCC